MTGTYDRYTKFRDDSGQVRAIPFISIPKSAMDLYITFDRQTMRFDNLSYKYYGDPNFAWLILQANPSYGGYEYAIPDGVTLRIPYPIEQALNSYEGAIETYLATH